jgi:hypothetical protein
MRKKIEIENPPSKPICNMGVHAVVFGYNLVSEPLTETAARELQGKLEEKGIACYVSPMEEERERDV